MMDPEPTPPRYLNVAKITNPPSEYITGLTIGLDECRRGAVLGDAFVCGSTRAKTCVRDSKTYSKAELKSLGARLADTCTHVVIRISPQVLDEFNLNMLFAEAFVEIINTMKPQVAIVDAPWSDTLAFTRYLQSRTRCKRIIAEHKADEKYVEVATASIIGKFTAEEYVARLKNTHGDFGSGYPADPKTIDYLQSYPRTPLRRKKWKLKNSSL